MIKKILISFLLFLPIQLLAQTDTEFWFVVPDVTILHNYNNTISNSSNGYVGSAPAYFRFANGNKVDTWVTMSMPANPYDPIAKTGFKDTTFKVDKLSLKTIDVTKFIVSPYPWSTQSALFEYDITSGAYNKKVTFTGGASNGNYPYGSLIQAANGLLYGMTRQGGANDRGTIFEYNPVTSAYNVRANLSNANGEYPNGSLLQASNGMLYGMTTSGNGTAAPNNQGVIFQFNPNAPYTYTKIFNFNVANNGQSPYGSLIEVGGKLYGMTCNGGGSGYGVLFEINFNGTGYTKKVDFTGTAGAFPGRNPYGSLINIGNKLYGLTSRGGTTNTGVLFEYDLGTSTYSVKYNFNTPANGNYPYGSLLRAANGNLYGMTFGGGTTNNGVIFEYNIATSTYSKLFEFDGAVTGRNPYGSLMQAANGNLYGMTTYGGVNKTGTLFEYNIAGSTFSKKYDFKSNDNTGNNPYYGALLEVSNKLYGLALGLAPYPYVEDNLLMENKPSNVTGINKVGIKIVSTLDITGYFESGTSNNKDLFALKGKNALGSEFWTPFQTLSKNQTFAAPNEAYSSIDIVATKNNTVVTIKLPTGITAGYGYPEQTPATNPFSVTLQAGETFCLYPAGKNVDPTKRLAGTKITTQDANHPIAITIKDDSDFHNTTNTGSYDLQGDQLIPTSIIGKEYAVINTGLSTGSVYDDLYVLTTQPSTNVTIDGTSYSIANAGTQKWVQFPAQYATKPFIRVIADKPVYVWHVGGFGGEAGGAILPAIDKCTGSSRISFARSYTEPFYIMLMVRKGAENSFQRTIGTDTTKLALPPITWYDLGFTSNWLVGKIDASSIAAGDYPLGAHTFMNSMDVFHLAIINGNSSGGCYYGYFSDYSVFNPKSIVLETGGAGNILCYGDSASLKASGGTKYNWTPSDFLNNTFIEDPVAKNVTRSITYFVTVSGACGLSSTKRLDLIVGSPVDAKFTTDVFSGCAPLTVNFTNLSTGATANNWDFNSDGDMDDPGEGLNNSANFPFTFDNTTGDTIRYYITLSASSSMGSCVKDVTKSILVYPRISASFTPVFADPMHCNPLSVTFNNTSKGKVGAPSAENGLKYSWNFGDGGSSYDKNPTHVFVNNFDPGYHDFVGSLTITDKYNTCSSTIPTSVKVYPYIKASFVIDSIERCSPFNLTVVNDSRGGGAISSYSWDQDGDLATGPGGYEVTVPGLTGWSKQYTNTTITNTPKPITIRLKVMNSGGCTDVASNTIIVNPPVSANLFINNFGNPDGCSPLNLGLTSSHQNATIFHWLVNDTISIFNQDWASYTFENFSNASITKKITFKASNVYGCSKSVSQNVVIQPFIKANFALDKEVGCSPLTVNITNTSSIGANAFQWDLDANGTIESAAPSIPAQTFNYPIAQNGTFNPYTRLIKLTANRLGSGCTSSITKSVQVNPQSLSDFSYSDLGNLNHCSPLVSNFTENVTNAESLQWQFGLYGASTSSTPSFTFTNTTDKNDTVPVLLTTNNRFGCIDTTIHKILVRPGVKALFSIDKTAGCPPYDINVLATPPLVPVNYTWNFDGTFDSGQSKKFTVNSNRTGNSVSKNITLTVGNGFCSDFTTKTITVYPEVKASYKLESPFTSLTGCSPLTVNFHDQSAFYGTNSRNSLNILWNFDDNSSSTDTAKIGHTFVNPDHTNVKNFNLKLTATTDKGCTDDTTLVVNVNPPVKAAFNTLITQPCTPVAINVKDVSFVSPTDPPTITWTYTNGILLNPVDKDFDVEFGNTSTSAVNRIIKLFIRNRFGCEDSVKQTFTIDPEVVAALALTTPADSLCAPAKFSFDNHSSGLDLTYTWDFKDGVTQTTNTTASFDHTFENRTSKTKKFNVQLTAVNLKGCTSSVSRLVGVYPEVDAKFSMTRDSSCTPFYIKLRDESLNGKQWSWDFGHTILGVPQTRTSNVAGETFTKLIDNETVTDQIKTYKIRLTLDDLGTGCKDTISQKLEVYPRVVSSFTVTPISGCSPTTITFNNGSSGLGSYLWELDNGLSFTQATPTPLSISNTSTVNDKIVNIKLTSTNVLGCKAVSSKNVTIAPTVKASFTSSIIEGCDPFTANFTNLTPSTAYNYSWSVNGTPQVVTQDYSRNFTNLSNPPVINKYKILLESSYKLNATCKDTVSKTITVYPRVYPNFTFSNVAGCHPLTTNMTNSTVAYNNSATYSWNLGNGTYSTLKDLTNQLYKNNSSTKDTTYNIKLIARSIHQCADSVTKSITVYPKPIASYVMDNESVSCSPFLVTLNNLSNGQEPLNYTFDFSDGPNYSTTNKNEIVTHTYHNTSAANKDYNITLTTTTLHGCTHSTSQTVYAYPEVKSKFSLDKTDGCSPLTVSFTGNSDNGYFYQWFFRDGTNSNLMSPSHRFVNITEKDTTFNVRLRTISAYDCEDDTIVPVTVFATPVANFGIKPPLKIYPDATFNFTNQSAPAANAWTYSWDFGDGFTSNIKEPGDHTYLKWGPNSNDNIYEVELIVKAPHCADTTTNILRLLPAVPIPFFDANVYSSCSPLEVHFVNASQYGKNYIWDFADGTNSTEAEPIHVFTEPGYYVVKLMVEGDGGTSFYYKTFRVFQNPIASFKAFPNRVMLPNAEVHLYNLTQFGNNYLWTFGDGETSTEKDPVHKYKELGEFKVTLTAWSHDTLGLCEDFVSVFPAVWVEGVGKVDFPNAFVPNKNGSNGGVYDDVDYKNEVFHPVHDGVTEYKLMIFNRWGEQLFESTDVKIGWDGYYKGKLCDQGVYIWRAIGKFTNGRSFDKKGNVTLLR